MCRATPYVYAQHLELRYHTISNEITIRVAIAADTVPTLTGTQ